MERASERDSGIGAYRHVTVDNASGGPDRVPERGADRDQERDAGGTLTLAAVPIGTQQDASPRLIAALGETPIVAAEDTRRARRLAAALGVRLTGSVISYYDDVEAARVPGLLAELLAGRDVLLVTDAGMPGISDPGYRLVAAAAQAGIRVSVLPGPSAVTAALAVSGLAAEQRTLIFFESPRRLAATLAGLAEAFGKDRAAVVCRELTKTHEEVIRGAVGDLAEWAAEGVLGEVTIVVAGAPRAPRADPADAAEEVAARERAGTPRKAAIAEVAKELGLPKREVYDAVVRRAPDTR